MTLESVTKENLEQAKNLDLSIFVNNNTVREDGSVNISINVSEMGKEKGRCVQYIGVYSGNKKDSPQALTEQAFAYGLNQAIGTFTAEVGVSGGETIGDVDAPVADAKEDKAEKAKVAKAEKAAKAKEEKAEKAAAKKAEKAAPADDDDDLLLGDEDEEETEAKPNEKYDKKSTVHAAHLKELILEEFGKDWKTDEHATARVKKVVKAIHEKIDVLDGEGEVLESFQKAVRKALAKKR